MPSFFARQLAAKETEDKKSPKGKEHTKVKSVNIERANNGFTVSHRHEEKPAKGGKMPMYEETKQDVFQKKDDAIQHANDLFDSKGDCPSCS